MVIYKYYINGKYNASALTAYISSFKTSPCFIQQHPDVLHKNMGILSTKTWG